MNPGRHQLNPKDNHALSSLYYEDIPLMNAKEFDECCQRLRIRGHARKANGEWVITPSGRSYLETKKDV